MDSAKGQLELMRQQQSEAQFDGEDPRTEGEGESQDGLVRAVMGPDGRLMQLELDERSTHISRSELQRSIIEAVNDAWAMGRGADADDSAVANIDPGALTQSLNEARDQAVQSMNRITEGLLDAMRQIERSTRQ
ncbi:YbaB/EbfC family nucleoid-associated protein [Allorhizocola rhizosphaerae]|uniref:YbaB/EbfC family nucleoid-associated protein n=1 Tax=Allorhizocola rhizosphaerae TaxID=1872709 RepID=UPI0013C2E6C2|nr:YbaB/EbfC family nucleoid-associated protein [Allorhizocola rhizosphaerae]